MRLLHSVLASVLVLVALSPAQAMRIAAASLPQRLATADVVVVGKVVGFEDKTVEAPRFRGDMEKGRYLVAIVKVDDVLSGPKGLKEIRVGFIPPVETPPNPGPGVIRPGIRRAPQVNLLKDQEGCFLLVKHPGGFYYAQQFEDVLKKDNASFDKEVAEARRYAALLADPKAGLQAKDPQDRFLTAGMLIFRYRTASSFADPQDLKQEPIDAAESKAILKALAGADWSAANGLFRFTPQLVFARLALTEKDGWKPPQDFKQFPDEAKKWLEANAEGYRIQRYVGEKK